MSEKNKIKFPFEKLLSHKELNKLLGLDDGNKQDLIEIGIKSLSSANNEIDVFMNLWTSKLDVFLQKLRNIMDKAKAQGKEKRYKKAQLIYILFFQQRGCTFYEYVDLFDLSIQPEDYFKYPAFEFFCIVNDQQRRKFIFEQQATKESFTNHFAEYKLPALNFFFERLSAMIPYSDMKRHTYVSGKSGSGKSELLKTLFYRLQKRSSPKNFNTLILIDPTGDLAKEIKTFRLNKKYQERLIYIDPFLHKGYAPTINPLRINSRGMDAQQINLMTEDLVQVFDELLLNDSSLSGNMRAILFPCIYTLIKKGNSSLRELQRFMNDDENQDLLDLALKVAPETHKPILQKFRDSFYKRTKQSVFVKLQNVLNAAPVANALCGKNTIDLEKEMNSGKIIVFNLAQGELGKQSSTAYGAFLVAFIAGLVRRRVKIKKEFRKPTFLFIDECQNYMTDSTKEILDESRKYGIHFVLANQFIHQLKERWKDSIMSNTDVKILGRNTPKHFREMAEEFGIDKKVLKKLKKFNFYVKSGDRNAIKFKTSPALTRLDDTNFFLNKTEIEELDNYLLYKSGIYRKLPNTKVVETENTEDIETRNGKKKKRRFSSF